MDRRRHLVDLLRPAFAQSSLAITACQCSVRAAIAGCVSVASRDSGMDLCRGALWLPSFSGVATFDL